MRRIHEAQIVSESKSPTNEGSRPPANLVHVDVILTDPANPTGASSEGRPTDITMLGQLQEISRQPGRVAEVTVTRRNGVVQWGIPKDLQPTNTTAVPATPIEEPTSWVGVEGKRKVELGNGPAAKPSESSPLARFLDNTPGDVTVRLRLESAPPDSEAFQDEVRTLRRTVAKKSGYDTDPTRTAQAQQASTKHNSLLTVAEAGNGGHLIKVAVAADGDDKAFAAAQAFGQIVVATAEHPFAFSPTRVGRSSDEVFAISVPFMAISEEVDAMARPSVTREFGEMRLVPRPRNFAQNGPSVPAGEPWVSLGTIVPTQVEPGSPRAQLDNRPFMISQKMFEGNHRGIVGAPNVGKSVEMMGLSADVAHMYQTQVPDTVLTSLWLDMSKKLPETQLLADMLSARAGQSMRVVELTPGNEKEFAYGIGGLLNPLEGESKIDHGLRFVKIMSLASTKHGGVYAGDVQSFVETTINNAWFGHGSEHNHTPGLIELKRPVTPDDLMPAFEKAIEDLPSDLQAIGRTQHGRELINSMRRLTSDLNNPAWREFFTSTKTINWLAAAENGEFIAVNSNKLPPELSKLTGLTVLGNIKVAQDILNGRAGNRSFRTGTYVDEAGELFEGPAGAKYAEELAQGRSRGSAASRGGNTMTLAAQKPSSLEAVTGLVRTYVAFAVPDVDKNMLHGMVLADEGQAMYAHTMGTGEAQAFSPGMHSGPARLLTASLADRQIVAGSGRVVSPQEVGLINWGIYGKEVSLETERNATDIRRRLPQLTGWVHLAVWGQHEGEPAIGIKERVDLAAKLSRLDPDVRDIAVTQALEQVVNNVHDAFVREDIDPQRFLAYMAPRLRDLASGTPLPEELPRLDLISPERVFVPFERVLRDAMEPQALKRYPVAGKTALAQIRQIEQQAQGLFRTEYGELQDRLREIFTEKGTAAPRFDRLGGNQVPGDNIGEQFENLRLHQAAIKADPSLLGKKGAALAEALEAIVEYRDNAIAKAPRYEQTSDYEMIYSQRLGRKVVFVGGTIREQLKNLKAMQEDHTYQLSDPLSVTPTSGEILLPGVEGGNPLERVAHQALTELAPRGELWRRRRPKDPDTTADTRSVADMVEKGNAQVWLDKGLRPFTAQLDMDLTTLKRLEQVLGREINEYSEYFLPSKGTGEEESQ